MNKTLERNGNEIIASFDRKDAYTVQISESVRAYCGAAEVSKLFESKVRKYFLGGKIRTVITAMNDNEIIFTIRLADKMVSRQQAAGIYRVVNNYLKQVS